MNMEVVSNVLNRFVCRVCFVATVIGLESEIYGLHTVLKYSFENTN